mgnify:CR=1 FL=1
MTSFLYEVMYFFRNFYITMSYRRALSRRRAGLFVFSPGILVLTFFAALLFFPPAAHAQSAEDAKAELHNQLNEVKEQIAELERGIDEARAQQKSLSREIGVLDKAVEKQQLQLKEIDLSVREAEEGIREKSAEISGLEDRLKEKKVLLHASVQRLNEYDAVSWVGMLFSGMSLSDFFNQMRYLESLQGDVNEFIAGIDDVRRTLEAEKLDLEDRKSDAVQLRNLSSVQKQTLEKKQKQKVTLLMETKGQEKLFSQNLKRSQKDITLLRQQLYTLESVGVSMSLGEAVEKAKFTGQKTGVRPAFLLAIFQVESKLGTYVGGGSWRRDMKPAERPLFLRITQKLGLDPDAMPVSKKPSYGWGGAMGAAQFIPSTWLVYEAQVAGLTGHSPPSPWNVEDAFIASGLKLVSNGAGTHAHKDEHTAAAKYLGGSNYKKRVAQVYANNVMDWAEYYQEQIDVLSGVSARPAGAANSL